MYHLSDSDSHDSDDGIRFKTDSTRYKAKNDLTKCDFYSKYKVIDRRGRISKNSRSRSCSPRRKHEKEKYHKKSYDSKKSTSTYLPSRKSTSHARKETSQTNSSSLYECSSANVAKPELCGPILPSFCANKSMTSENIKNCIKDDYKNSHSNKTQLSEQSTELPHESTINAISEQYGPVLPPSATNTLQDTNNIKDHSEVVGPSLPPHFDNGKKKIYGPALCPFNKIQNPLNSPEQTSSGTSTNYLEQDHVSSQMHHYDKILDLQKNSDIDSNLTHNSEETIDDECYGPLPFDMVSNSKAYIALEERALQMKIDKLQQSSTDHVTREEWMIELPEVHSKRFGLGPRQFRPNAAPDFSDRSSWTDTPQDKAQRKDESNKKVDAKKLAEIKEQQKYDQEQEKVIKKHKKDKKEKSLVEIHQINLSKKKKEEGSTSRRPFSRDIDLKVNHFDEAQKKAILKKAQLLDDRFSTGQSKFL